MSEYIRLQSGLVIVEKEEGVLIGHVDRWCTLLDSQARTFLRGIVDWVQIEDLVHSTDCQLATIVQLIHSLDEMGFIDRKPQEFTPVEFVITHYNEVGALLTSLLMHHGIPVKILEDRTARFSDVRGVYLRISDVGYSINELLEAQQREFINSGKMEAPLEPSRLNSIQRAQIVVITTYPEPELLAHLMERDINYICTLTSPFGALVGPFVTPGLSPCFHCIELHRSETHEEWQKVAMALFLQRNESVAPDHAYFAAAIIGSFLLRIARGEIPHEIISATRLFTRTETRAGYSWPSEREIASESRHWSFHPDCSCHWGRRLSTRAG